MTLSGNILFSSLDGSAQDSDGLVNGVFTVNGDLIVDGTINCNDDAPLPMNSGACPIWISVSGDLTMRAGSGIFAENRRGGGAGGSIQLTVGHDLILRGPSGALPGAIVSSSRLTGSAEPAGSMTASVHGNTLLEAGSTIAASTSNGAAGTIGITSDGTVTVAGLIASGPSRQVLGTKLSGQILDGGGGNQSGGAILIRSHSSVGPGIRVESGGIVVSQGAGPGAQLVELEACGLEIRGLVASLLNDDGPSQVVLRSGKGLLIDGRDLGASGTRAGRVRADSLNGGAAGAGVDLFAEGDVQVLGPATASLPAVSSSPGDHPHSASGMIMAISRSGSLTAAGFAFEAGESRPGDQGGLIDLRSKGNATLDGATLGAVGGYTSSASGRQGGRIAVRSYQGAVSWTFGAGDVRPVGSGVSSSVQGAISLTACSGIDITGSQFPVNGAAIPPFPAESDGVCSPAAPTLPSGEPPLPVCNRPPVANGQTVTTNEDTSVTITLTGSDPDGNPLTFAIVTPPAHGTLGPLTSPTATSVQVVYTPAPDYNGPDSFIFQVDDGNGGTSTATVTLSVTSVNDAPKVDAATFTLSEHSPSGTAVGTVTFTDPDAGQGHTFAITAGNTGGAFAIDLSTGQITVANSSAVDFGTTPTFSLTVQVTDDGTPVLAGTATVTINLVNVNDSPVVTPATFSVPENSANGTVVGTVTFSDPDSGAHAFAILSGNTGGAFAVNPSTGVITVANSAALNFESTPVFSLTVQVTDDGTPPLSGTAVITINLLDVNEAPMVNPATFTVDENSPAGTAVGMVTFSDPDVSQAHTFAITAGNTGGAFAIDPSSGAITVAGVINFEAVPAYSLTVQVTDGGSPTLSGTATIAIAVNNLNEPPVAVTDTYTALGNTQLRVAGAEGSGLVGTTSSVNPLANDSDPDTIPDFKTLTLTPSTGTTAKGGDYSLAADGSFTYTPPAGVVSANASDFDTFTYTLSDGTNTVTGTVQILIQDRVWYVRDRVDSLNLAGGDGRSTDAFETLAAAETASQAGDILFVFRGDTGTTPLSGGLTLKDGQKLWGEGIGLTVPGFGTLVAAGSRPRIDNTSGNVVSVPATAGNLQNVEIRGLDLQASGNAIKVSSSGSNLASLTVSDNALTAMGNAFDARTAAGANALTIDFSKNTVTSGLAGVLIDGSAGGTITITGFKDNVVSQNSTGTGIAITSARFDGIPGGSYQTVVGGTTVVGSPGNGVGGAGMLLSNVMGDLAFDNLDIFADGGAGLRVGGTGAVNIGPGTGTRVTVGAGVAILEAIGGPAVDVSNATIDLQPASIKSTNSATTGVALNSVSGTFAAGSGSSISGITSTSGTAFQVGSSSASVSYAGTINTATGTGVSLTGNTGTIGFTGTLTLSTGSNPAFIATGGGTVTTTDTASTLTTTTGTALNVANTTIGASGLKFRSISAGTAASGPANGIVLNNTGALGGLTVSGTGSSGSGGTIRKGATGISLTSTRNVSLSFMQLNDFTDYAIHGASVINFSMANTVISGTNGDDPAANEGSVRFTELTGTATITNSNISGSVEDTFSVVNTTGTLNRITFTNDTFGANATTTGDNGLLLEAQSSAVLNATVQNSFFTSARGDLVQATITSGATGSMDMVFTGNTLSDNHPAIVAGGGGTLFGGVGGTFTYNISTNTFKDATGDALVMSCGGTGSTCTGRIENNQIGLAGLANSGSTGGSGIALVSAAGGSFTSLVNNNVVRQYNNTGIRLQAGDMQGNSLSFNVTVTNNTVGNPGSINTNFNGIQLNNGTVATDNFTSCVDIRSNSISGSGSGAVAPNNADFRLRQRQSTTVRLPGYGGANNNDAAVVSFVSGNNTVTAGASSNTVPTGGGYVGGTACSTPL